MKTGFSDESPTYAFKGKYVWLLERFNVEPSIHNAHLINQIFMIPEDKSLDMLDAATFDGRHGYYLFKYPLLFVGSLTKMKQYLTTAMFEGLEYNIDAASYIYGDGRHLITCFKG